jgi:hypothetical protein
MLNTLRTAIYTQPYVAALPGAMIFITSIAFNLLSDGLARPWKSSMSDSPRGPVQRDLRSAKGFGPDASVSRLGGGS